MPTPRKRKRLLDTYRFPGFRPEEVVKGVFGDPKARVISLVQRSKKRPAASVAGCTWVGTTASGGACATCPVPIRASTSSSRCAGCVVGAAAADAARLDAIIEDNENAQTVAGHWGVPLFVFAGEPFFGQDRVDHLLWRMKQTGLKER